MHRGCVYIENVIVSHTCYVPYFCYAALGLICSTVEFFIDILVMRDTLDDKV